MTCMSGPFRPVKVLHLITGLEVGGTERGLLSLLPHLSSDRIHSVVACLYNNGRIGRQIEEFGFRVADMQMRSFCDLRGLWRLYRLLRKERPEVLHTRLFRANLWGRVVGKIAGIPVIISSEHSMTREQIEGRRRTWYIDAANRWTAHLCDRIVAVSNCTRGYLIESGIPAAKVEVIMNFVATEPFAEPRDGSQVRQELDLGSGPVVTAIARLHPVKNLGLLIDAIACVRRQVARPNCSSLGRGEKMRCCVHERKQSHPEQSSLPESGTTSRRFLRQATWPFFAQRPKPFLAS